MLNHLFLYQTSWIYACDVQCNWTHVAGFPPEKYHWIDLYACFGGFFSIQ